MNRMITLASLILLAITVNGSLGQDQDWDDRELVELHNAAISLGEAGRIGEAIDAWDEFVATVDRWRAEGRPYGEPMEVLRFHANLSIALMLDAGTARLENELARLGPQEAGPTVIAHLSRTEHFLRAYLEQFGWAPQDIPQRIADDPGAEFGAVHMLGSLLVNRGRWHESLGDVDTATSDWTAAKSTLSDAIARMLGHGLDEPGAPALSNDIRFLSMMAERYLKSVGLVDGPGVYVEQARSALGWLPHDDHAVVIQIRSQAADWAREGINLDEASALCGLVRDVHRDWFDGEFAHLADNVWAHLVDIAIAIDQGDLEKAATLLEALEAIPGLSAIDQARADELRRQLGSELDVARLLDDIFEIVDRGVEGQSSSPSRASGSLPPEQPAPRPGQAETPEPVAASAPRAVDAQAPSAAGGTGRGRMATATVITVTVAAVAGVMVIAVAVLRRCSRRE